MSGSHFSPRRGAKLAFAAQIPHRNRLNPAALQPGETKPVDLENQSVKFPKTARHRKAGCKTSGKKPDCAPGNSLLLPVMKTIKNIGIGLVVAAAIIGGTVWVLEKSLGNFTEVLYEGKPADFWNQKLDGRDPATSNETFAIINNKVIPKLVDAMFHDTNDSGFRSSLVAKLNEMPGIQIDYLGAEGRRFMAAGYIGVYGQAAKGAIPVLLQAVKGSDPVIRPAAIASLGKIHGDPDAVIPVLIHCLDDDAVDSDAATALGEFGPLAKAAVPKLIPMVHSRDKDAVHAAKVALKKIDPDAAKQAGVR